MQSISTQRLQLLIGLLIGLFVLSQITSIPEVVVNQDHQEESDIPSSHTEQVKVSEAVTSSGSQINLGFQSFLLQEVLINTIEKSKKSSFEVFIPPAKKALNVLFRRIISPNGP